MINVETIKFVKMLEEFAEASAYGIEPFAKATEESYGIKIHYDDRIIEGEEGYKVVADACIVDDPECYHHDIISYWDEDSLEYKIRVIIDETGIPYLNVKLLLSDEEIVVENGKWYFA